MLCHFCHFCIYVTLWTVALQAPLSMGFSRQEYWSGLPCSPSGDFPNPGIEPTFLVSVSPALAGRFFITSAFWGVPIQKPKKKLTRGLRRHFHSLLCFVNDLLFVSLNLKCVSLGLLFLCVCVCQFLSLRNKRVTT